MMLVHLTKPRSFILQWHITERCNWHCKHCYQDESIEEELTTERLFEILRQYLFLIKKWNLPKRFAILSITGGEPFIRKDFFQFIEEVGKHSDLYTWGLLSNGTFLTKKITKKLKDLGIFNYQVSLEGLEKNNDAIRGKGSFKKVINAIKLLVEGGINTRVSLTLTKQNMDDIPALVGLLDKLGVHALGPRRHVPIGRGLSLKKDLLDPLELKEFYLNVKKINEMLHKKGSKLSVVVGCEAGVFNDEIVGFTPKMRKHHCGIPDGRVLIVMPNGNILPCRRLPIVIGNAMKQSLFEIWYSNNFLWELRNLNNAHPFCQKCHNFNQCFGGAKCVTYAYYNKLFVPDVQCWKYQKKLLKPNFFNNQKTETKKEVRLMHNLTKENEF